jgi:hypothetical protein
MSFKNIKIKNNNDKVCLELIQEIPYKFDEIVNIKIELERINILNNGYLYLRKIISKDIPDRVVNRAYFRCVTHSLSSSIIDPMIPSGISIQWDEIDNFIEHDINFEISEEVINKTKQKIKDTWEKGIEKIKKISEKLNNTDSNEINIQQLGNLIILKHPEYSREIKMNKNRYDHMFSAWQKNKKSDVSFQLIAFCLLMRYDYLYDLSTYQLSTHPLVLSTLAKTYSYDNIACELCASIINNNFDIYCSLFYDLEKHFGSLGSYTYITPVSGLITIGVFPAISVVKDMLTRDWFSKSNDGDNLTIYIKLQGGWGKSNDLIRLKNNKIITQFYSANIDKTLENYDKDMIEMRNDRYGKNDPIDEYLDKIASSKYLKHHCLIESKDYRWVDYIKNQSHCNNDIAIYILSNTKIRNPDISKLKYPHDDIFKFQPYKDKSQQKTAENAITWLCNKYNIRN